MKKSFTLLFLAFVLLFSFGLQAQTMDYKTGYQFPTADEDSVLNGLSSVRGSDFHPNPLGDGVAAFAATNYAYNGSIHLFKNIGDDAMELVWSSPVLDSLGGASHPRFVKFGDLDNDGIIELIAPMDLNGILIYEWDGVAGSWNFGDAPARVIAEPLFPGADSSTSYHNVEFMDIADLDNDGKNELMFANNSTGTTYDRYYIFSIVGTYSTGDPGFSSIKREGHWPRNEVYGYYGGGTPYAIIAADLDGTGNTEMVFHNWNYAQVTPVRTTGVDTYELADTTGGGHYYYSTYPTDAVSLGGGTAFDIDKDGREEVYIPLYGMPAGSATVLMVHYEVGDDLSKIDSSNVMKMDLSSVMSGGAFYGRAGFGDYDSDGMPNLYFAANQGQYLTTAEFQGGDKTDPNNWTYELLYDGLDLDEKIYSAMTITDSASTADTVFTLQSETNTIGFKISAQSSFFDDDKYEDIIMPTQAWGDSIDITKYAWNGTKYDTSEYKIVEPNRISIRWLESSEVNAVRAKNIKVILPSDYKLEQNFPNPFNPTTQIQFYLPINKQISLAIYNSLGQKIKTLIDNEKLVQGSHQRAWDGTNSAGVKVASGMYVYELKYGNFKQQKRMILMK